MNGRVEFAKLNGLGNDFVIVDDLVDEIDLAPSDVRRICDRHFGIGADGVIVVKPPRDAANTAFMHYINSDGTLAEMCGNGVRCFAKFLVDRNMAGADEKALLAETRAGVKRITYTVDEGGRLSEATVDMGAPVLEPALVPTLLEANAFSEAGNPYVADAEVPSPFGTYRFTCISMGNPHAVAFVDDCDALDVDAVGSFYECCDRFPAKANIEFATVRDDGIHMRVYERGCGETLACGTGACATGVAAYLTGRAPRRNDLVLRGGTLHIDYSEEGSVFMTGPAVESFTGSFDL